jgi:hypothetical protein
MEWARAVFSPDGSRLVTVGPGSVTMTWDVGLETRSSQAVSELVAREVALELREGHLVPRRDAASGDGVAPRPPTPAGRPTTSAPLSR